MPWTREQLAQRAAKELQDGFYVNLGIGLPTLVANHVPAGIEVWLQSENGLLGIGPFPTDDEVDADTINAGRHVVGHQGRQPDAEVDVEAVLQFLGGARRHLVPVPCHDLPLSYALRVVRCSMRFSGFGLTTMRCTKMPGVCSASGSIPPTSTSSSTSTIVTLPAMAQSGLKLRAVLW